ncbi:hypothetical protein [Kitasatospora kifunensis]|uniref:Uncharacterized protein n=1 Tax=Kitasatospora kifunensis TaxID=58351 RepID=A0A7W7VZU5_KITKI|nr:hypothetical protein [Kitasatospora kifunensis]MBB4929172.1 hypothetical protein [Kitasatospora kifunensis]
MPFFARKAMATAGPITANGQVIACPRCGGTTNHQLLYPRKHTDEQATIKCRSGHQFTSPHIPADVVNRVRFADEGKVQLSVRGRDGKAVTIKTVIAKNSMAEPKGGAKGGALAKGAAATAAKTGKVLPAAPTVPARRVGGGSGALTASINLLAASVNTVAATVSTVGTVAGAAGQIAGAVATTTSSVAKVGTEGLGLARDSVKVGGRAVDGRIKDIATERAHTEAQRVREHQAAQAEAKRNEAVQTRAEGRAEAQRVRESKAFEIASARQHKADEAQRLREHKAAEAAAARSHKAEQARLRGEAAERARQERIAKRRAAGQRGRKQAAKAKKALAVPETEPVEAVDLTEYT